MPKSSENKRKTPKTLEFSVFGGDKRDRTADLLNAIQALSQLSYTPIFSPLPDDFCIIAQFADLSIQFFENFQKYCRGKTRAAGSNPRCFLKNQGDQQTRMAASRAAAVSHRGREGVPCSGSHGTWIKPTFVSVPA